MLDDVVIEMMSNESVYWRCLHGGPLTPETVDAPEPHPLIPWDRIRKRNVPLLKKLTEVYGSCAVLARDGEHVIGQLRFYPKAICNDLAQEANMCLQQVYPNGPADDLVDADFPPPNQMSDKALCVHCMMIRAFQQESDAYLRKGLASRMARALIEWARRHEWHAIETHAYADLPCVYAITGQAGKAFWGQLGFHVVDSCPEPALDQDEHDDFVKTLLAQAAEHGIAPAVAKTRYTMRLDIQ